MILYIGFVVMLVILIIYQHEEIKVLEEIIIALNPAISDGMERHHE
jgi:hypothetical protein